MMLAQKETMPVKPKAPVKPKITIPEELINDEVVPFSQEWAKENMGL